MSCGSCVIQRHQHVVRGRVVDKTRGHLSKEVSPKSIISETAIVHSTDEGTQANDHLLKFNKIIDDLLKVDINLEEEDMALLVSSSFPPSYEHLITTVMEDIFIPSFKQTKKERTR